MRFALAGNPNSGKTTLFNALTGSTARVGNWPGVTVDRKEGVYKKLGEPINIIDLPGIYSLSPYTPEEVVARNYVVDENPDLVVNIIDGTNLERNLYLTTQLLETDRPVVVAINMIDLVRKDGTTINIAALAEKLGVPVMPISALTGDGITALMQAAYGLAKAKRAGVSVLAGSSLGTGFNKIVSVLQGERIEHPTFHAVKMLEGDHLENAHLSEEIKKQIEEIKGGIKLAEELDGDFAAAVADARYRYITDNLDGILVRSRKAHELSRSDKIDRVLTNKWLGIPLFLFFMFLVFHLTFSEDLLGAGLPSPGVWLQCLTEDFVGYISEQAAAFLQAQNAAEWTKGMVVDGMIGGVGAVISFLPQILMLFLFLSIMEDSGYMARAAFLMDRLLRRFGLSGRAFMPLLMGFGCSVPAMMGTRTLVSEKERRLAIMLMPFFSCGAKLPIWAMFSAAIFPENPDRVVFMIYVTGIATAGVAAIILQKTLLKGEAAPFIMELPPYHTPQLSSLVLHLWEKLKGFVLRATTIIAGSTVIIWFLANFSFSLEIVEHNSAESILAVLGASIVPLFKPLGFAGGDMGWRPVVAILTGLLAKEMVVSTMGVLYNPDVSGDALESDEAGTALAATLAAVFTPLAAISFMVFNLLSVPCMAAVASASGEMRSVKWMFITIAFWLTTAWVVSFLIYNVGALLGYA